MTDADALAAFADLLKRGEHKQAAERFNAADIVSIEAMEGPMARAEGRDAVKAKSYWWYAAHELHSSSADGPYANGNQFIMRFEMDVTVKETGQRMQMAEAGLYTMRDGQIVEERFFY
ncbi:MAG: SnoaL-like domain-containing protein [Bosea sp. (in: a-proteobacteria)]